MWSGRRDDPVTTGAGDSGFSWGTWESKVRSGFGAPQQQDSNAQKWSKDTKQSWGAPASAGGWGQFSSGAAPQSQASAQYRKGAKDRRDSDDQGRSPSSSVKRTPSWGQASPRGEGEYHYKSDGTLDMRFASSKAARDRGECDDQGRLFTGGSSVKRPTSSASSRGSARAVDGEYHFKKDGSLDMRFASSKAARDRGECDEHGWLYSGVRGTPEPQSAVGGLHFRRDGGLDMRYSSSKEARDRGECDDQGNMFSSSVKRPVPGSGRSPAKAADEYHYKSDGTLDMRFASSKAARDRGECDDQGRLYSGFGAHAGSVKSKSSWGSPAKPDERRYASKPTSDAAPVAAKKGDYHYKADGTLDMRFVTSKAALARGECDESGHLYSKPQPASCVKKDIPPSNVAPKRQPPGRPAVRIRKNDLHFKNDGSLDMRYATSKAAVAAGWCNSLGRLLPEVTSYLDHEEEEDSDVEFLGTSSTGAWGSP